MAKCARLSGGAREYGACRLVEPRRPRLVWRRRDGDEALLRRLLGDAERASDLSPAATGRARFLHEVVHEFVGDAPDPLAELDRCGQSFERRRTLTLRLDRADEALECRLGLHSVNSELTRPRQSPVDGGGAISSSPRPRRRRPPQAPRSVPESPRCARSVHRAG
jgi:hypothetical protein